MNPTEIYDALESISKIAFNPTEFPFAFAEATGNAEATVSKLRTGVTNKSDLQNGVLLNRKFHFAPAIVGMSTTTLDELRASKKTVSAKPAILIASDGEMVSAEHTASGDTLHCKFSEIGDNFGFFLPAAGIERYRAVEENPIDVKAAGKLAKLYDALIKTNPEWDNFDRRREMNQLMVRLVFCMFAEDVGIFSENQFSRLVFTHAGNNGEEARETIMAVFTALNQPTKKRDNLPAWTAELEYVNGGLFAGKIDAPHFDIVAFRYLRDACNLDWSGINPDIFGSMIQSLADVKARSELGMHYTSAPNIMKVIGPLFLDNLDDEIDKEWDNIEALRALLERMAKIRVFDPACGSGNFLVVSHRELRSRETKVLKRTSELSRQTHTQIWSKIPITNFYGIELTDFAVETAKLALFISDYQANVDFGEALGRMPIILPLREAAHIVHGNALRLDWKTVCPPPAADEEVIIVGNPPFLGKAKQDKNQKADRDFVFSGKLKSFKALDFVAGWTLKTSEYIRGSNASAALVSTNSLCQGASVSTLWPAILRDDIEIGFAHRSFKWRNSAANNAAVICVIIGLRNKNNKPKRLFDGDLETNAENINAYLLNHSDVWVSPASKSIFGLPFMSFGCMPYDAGNLLFTTEQKNDFLTHEPRAEKYVRRFMGSQEVVKGIERYCLWISDSDRTHAESLPAVRERIENTRVARLKMKDKAGKALAKKPHQFREHVEAVTHSILVPSVTSERRPYLPVERVGANVIASNLNQVLYDAPDWCIALIASRMHLVWIGTVCGRLESRYRYSNTLGWNTFPVPNFTTEQLDKLSASARRILKTRYSHYPKTIADLYDPDDMPCDLRRVHLENDELLEAMYRDRPFYNDTERLEWLFNLYAARIKQEAN